MNIAIQATDAAAKERAEELAARLPLPLIGTTERATFDFILRVSSQRVELCRLAEPYAKPLSVDFDDPQLLRRAHLANRRSEMIARAIGHQPGKQLNIVDATAGLGRDGFILASLGHRVHWIERSPVIAVLLEDGLRRLHQSRPELAHRLSLHIGEANQCLPVIARMDNLAVIYLDPMYPPRTKSALVKKEMRWLRQLVTEQDNSQELLELALRYKPERVVIKRPAYAPYVAANPKIIYQGKQHRFEVY